MMPKFRFYLFFAAAWYLIPETLGASLPRGTSAGDVSSNATSGPVVKLRQGTVRGVNSSDNSQELFLGIPYAQPPIGQLRFSAPQPIPGNKSAIIEASAFGPGCIQTSSVDPSQYSEDCLSVNVWRPAGVKEGSNVPVLVWIYGGAFISGLSSDPRYNATQLLKQSVQLGTPVVWVSLNYRLGAFGFLSSAEVAKAAEEGSAALNAALHDQRLALKWINQNIRKFGGDPDKVTVYGESAGAISIGAQLIANGGKPQGLFRAAIMESGSPTFGAAVRPDYVQIEKTYARLASMVGCGLTSESPGGAIKDRRGYDFGSVALKRRVDLEKRSTLLDCLRSVNTSILAQANLKMNQDAAVGTPYIPGDLAFMPVIDGYFYMDRPSRVLAAGHLADVPIITGDNLDEGTLFAPQNLNNTGDFENWATTIGAIEVNTSLTAKVMSRIFELYPDTAALGSPYSPVNVSNATVDRFFLPSDSNQFKRAASLFGDSAFEAGRRALLQAASKSHRLNGKNVWSYQFSRIDPGTPASLGCYHGSEIKYVYGDNSLGSIDTLLSSTMIAAWISFAVHLDPTKKGLNWPSYGAAKTLLQFRADNITTIHDVYREEPMAYLNSEEASYIMSR